MGKGGDGQNGVGGASVELDKGSGEAGGDGGERDDPEDEESLADEAGGAGGEFGCLGGGVDAGDDNPE